MNHIQIKAKQKRDLESELVAQKARLARRKKEHKADPTNDAKRHLISKVQTRVNIITKKLWEFE
jgi:hypothetical protein